MRCKDLYNCKKIIKKCKKYISCLKQEKSFVYIVDNEVVNFKNGLLFFNFIFFLVILENARKILHSVGYP